MLQDPQKRAARYRSVKLLLVLKITLALSWLL